MATHNEVVQLSEALKRANHASAITALSVEDAGTSNIDSPQIFLNGWTDKNIKDAFDNADLRYYINPSKKKGVRVVDIIGCTRGQGDRRTATAEAVRDSLRKDGYESYVFYQMD